MSRGYFFTFKTKREILSVSDGTNKIKLMTCYFIIEIHNFLLHSAKFIKVINIICAISIK